MSILKKASSALVFYLSFQLHLKLDTTSEIKIYGITTGSCILNFRAFILLRKMSASRLKMGIFYGKGDSGSWKKRMKVYLSYNKVGIALKADESKWTNEQKAKASEIKEEVFNF
ncbi:hypothetical protein FNV43_RR10450 [Rhamnella rubrinervis]|uniref:Uncharacterized protein n=1 Tax=Rhamnella rubrinervis TaxID=2594499 RepID=A0A8K0MKS7_9ROSA|nr:hypothetical protein FNV43_RR10450 [Rhamnella rubrinervis]